MLKAYMGYSRYGGSEDGTVLIFAHNQKEARKEGWACSILRREICSDEYIDLAVRRVKGKHLFLEADQQKLAADTAHVIDNPICCKRCEEWGKPLDAEGLCETCIEEAKTYE